MGDMADDYLAPTPPVTTWTTREGAQIGISEMGDRHLVNAARMVLRNAVALRAETIRLYGIMKLAALPKPNGEMAREAVDSEIDHEIAAIDAGLRDDEILRSSHATYNALRTEMERRGLRLSTSGEAL